MLEALDGRVPRVDPEPLLAEEAAEAAAPLLARLNKFLADHGVASRRACDQLIAEGHVSVDGEVVLELGTRIDPATAVVEVDGLKLEPKSARHRYYLLHKPAGVVCTSDARESRRRAIDLITDRNKGRIYTVGRLDEETTGLVLLTNDGDFANRVMHPRFGVSKTYEVKLAGRVDDVALQKVREGVHLAEGRTSGARVVVVKRSDRASQLLVSVREGMNREIRRVFARVGFKVLRLHRGRIGPIDDRGLRAGEWRPLTRAEVDLLQNPPQDRDEAPRGKRARGSAPAAEGADKRRGGHERRPESRPAKPVAGKRRAATRPVESSARGRGRTETGRKGGADRATSRSNQRGRDARRGR